jgi:hypothetical protein
MDSIKKSASNKLVVLSHEVLYKKIFFHFDSSLDESHRKVSRITYEYMKSKLDEITKEIEILKDESETSMNLYRAHILRLQLLLEDLSP